MDPEAFEDSGHCGNDQTLVHNAEIRAGDRKVCCLFLFAVEIPSYVVDSLADAHAGAHFGTHFDDERELDHDYSYELDHENTRVDTRIDDAYVDHENE